MDGTIVNFRQGRHTQNNNHMIIEIVGVEKKEQADALAGKQVSWIAPGKNNKEIKGVVASAHGNNGAVRVRFERGMPGQSVGTKVSIA